MIFGHTLSSLRHKRGTRQKTLAFGLGMAPSQLSRIETGRKHPPRSDAFVERVTRLLELSENEKSLLINCARADRELGNFAVGASPEKIKLAMHFANKLKGLTAEQQTAIEAILALNPDKNNA